MKQNSCIFDTKKTLQSWHNIFKTNNEAFPNPYQTRRNKNSILPPMLDSNPDFKNNILDFIVENRSSLTAEKLHDHIHEILIPKLLQKRKEEAQNINYTKDNLLHENGLKVLCIRTVLNWMHCLGLKYEEKKKSFYNNKHQLYEVIRDRYAFIDLYFEYELRTH